MAIIYCAGPISIGSQIENVRLGIEAAQAIHELGHTPFTPHLDVLWSLVYPHSWEEWLQLDLDIVSKCDGLYRIPGESKGADLEVAFALGQGIPVYMELKDIPRVERDWSRFDLATSLASL